MVGKAAKDAFARAARAVHDRLHARDDDGDRDRATTAVSATAPAGSRRRTGDGIRLGAHSYVGLDTCAVRFRYDDPDAEVVVGRYSSISRDVTFLIGGEHHNDWVTTSPLRELFEIEGRGVDGVPYSRGPITVGNDVWIGYGAVILSGATIGDGAVIGAGALVRYDVAPYTVVAGSPATVRRSRFAPEVVASLLRIRWWDWPDEQVKAAIDELSSPDLEAFCRKHDPAFAAGNAETGGAAL